MSLDATPAASRFESRRRRIEWPTILLAAVIYGGWLATTYFHASLPAWLVAVAGGTPFTQDPENPGVLVLSLLAGAAQEMDQALLVNPHDLDGVADAIATAATMPLERRKERWHAMMEHLRKHDIHAWRRDYLQALESA